MNEKNQYVVIHCGSRDSRTHELVSLGKAIAEWRQQPNILAVLHVDDPRLAYSQYRGYYVPAGDRYHVSPGLPDEIDPVLDL